MVSTRSRSSLRSGDADARAADAGQPEVSSTPRRSSRRLTKAAEPASTSGRANQGRLTRKAINLDAIEETEEPLPSPQQQQQQAGSASPSKPPPTTRRAAAAVAAAAAPASSHDEAAEQQQQQVEQQGSQHPGTGSQAAEHEEEEEEGAGEAPSSHPAAMGLSSLAADAGLLDKVASEMFAALEEAFCGGEAAGSGSDTGSDGEEQESGSEAEADMEGDEGGAGAHGGADIAGTSGDGVPRHLRWEPELQLPDSSSKAAGRQQQRKGLKAREEPLAKQMHVAPRDERALQRSRRGTAPDTAGKQWFDLPATAITDEVKRDLRMLRLRSAFDPKSFYKKFDTTKFPKHFQIGTVVESAADFYSGRLTNKERKRTFTEEIMSDPHLAQVRKKRFTKLQEEKSYWSNKKVARKTENERLKKKPRKPKH